jgi:SAM-dependent methyltransferase
MREQIPSQNGTISATPPHDICIWPEPRHLYLAQAGVAIIYGLDLSALVQSDGVYLISPPRQFAGGEEVYDEHIGGPHRDDRLRGGRGAWQLIAHYATRPVRTLLEIGAGSGACSLGLVAAASGAQTIITDTSLTFLQMIRRKMVGAGLSMQDTCFAILAGEDLARLPARSVDAIAVASALHHVSDWRAFLRDAAILIRPGGVLVIQEPCRCP